MQGFERLLKELVAPELTPEMKRNLKEWDEKLEAALNLSYFVPDIKNGMNNLLGALTDNHLNVNQVDKLIHDALNKDHEQHLQ